MVAIKGFKMPESCAECPLNYDTLACMAGDGNPDGPDIDSVTYKNKPWHYCEERHPACPLVEIPANCY